MSNAWIEWVECDWCDGDGCSMCNFDGGDHERVYECGWCGDDVLWRDLDQDGCCARCDDEYDEWV